jgi:hypothetical protein
MATRPSIFPFQVLNQTVSGSATTHSIVTIKPELSRITYSMVWAGTLAGTFTVEVSDDYSENSDGSVRNPGTWNTLPTSTTVTASGSPGNGFYDISTGAYAIRLTLTSTAGSGLVTEIVTGQVM